MLTAVFAEEIALAAEVLAAFNDDRAFLYAVAAVVVSTEARCWPYLTFWPGLTRTLVNVPVQSEKLKEVLTALVTLPLAATVAVTVPSRTVVVRAAACALVVL